jgi:hypothetical protein
MSLTKLTFRKISIQQNIVASTTADVLDLIFSGFASTTYADGSSRSSGAAYAWSAAREISGGVTQAVYCIPPPSGESLNQRIIFAGTTGTGALSPAPTMLRDTFSANNIYVGISKYSTTYSGWNQAKPFTTGFFGGYSQFLCSGSIRNNQIDYVNIWESPETFMIQALTSTDTTYNSANINGMAYCGAICDPESSDTIFDSEIDGRLYGISMGGNISGAAGNSNSVLYTGQAFGITNPTTTTSYFYSWSTSTASVSTSTPLFYCLVPGSGTFASQALFSSVFNTAYANSGSITITRSNSRGQVPLLAMNSRPATFAATFINPSFLGRVRETDLCLGTFANDIVIRDTGSNILGYSVSNSRTLSTTASMFLPYV